MVCEYLFDEAEAILVGIWILASLLYTFLSSTATGYIVYRFQDESHHLLGCSSIKNKTKQNPENVIIGNCGSNSSGIAVLVCCSRYKNRSCGPLKTYL